MHMYKKILVTGATGYIGHAVAKAAAEAGYVVHILVRNLSSPNKPSHPAIRCFAGDIVDKRAVMGAIAGCDAVIHCAGLTRLFSRKSDVFYRTNVEGTRVLLECAINEGAKRFVFTSSCAVAGPSLVHPLSEADPRITPLENDYEISKYLAEKMVRDSSKKIDAIIVAPSRVYGIGLDTQGNPITQFVAGVVKRRFAVVPSAKHVQGNYVLIDDVVTGHLLALEHGRNGEKYFLGGENVSYADLFETIRQNFPHRLYLFPISSKFMKIYAYLASTFNLFRASESHLSPRVVERLLQNRTISSEKAQRELGYKITPLSVGMHRMIKQITR